MGKAFLFTVTFCLYTTIGHAQSAVYDVEADGVILDQAVAKEILFSERPKILSDFQVLKVAGRELKAHVLERDSHITVRTVHNKLLTISCSEASWQTESSERVHLKRHKSLVIALKSELGGESSERFALISCETNPKTQQTSTSRRVGYQNASVDAPGAQ